MTLLPVADGCSSAWHSSQDPAPLAQRGHLPLIAHPRDARIKCVTEEHLQQVARLHGRPLQASRPLEAASPPLLSSQVSVPHVPENKVESASTACSFLTTYGASQQTCSRNCLAWKRRSLTLQEQITQLALALLQERERSVEHRLTTLESLLQPLVERQFSAPPSPEVEQEPPCPRRLPDLCIPLNNSLGLACLP